MARKEKSVPDFKASKDRVTLLLGANAAGNFKLKPELIYPSENLRALKNYAWSALPMLCKCFLEIFILLWWSGTEPTISSRYACVW